MAFAAFAAPILPGKEEEARQWISELWGPRYEEMKASRDRYGIHERTFLQHTPQGDIVIVTLEGDDPVSAFEKATREQDPFTRWFIQKVKDVHGFDLSKGLPGEPPRMVGDTQDRQAMRRAA